MAHINQVLFNLFTFEEKNHLCIFTVNFFMYNRFYISNNAVSDPKKVFQSGMPIIIVAIS